MSISSPFINRPVATTLLTIAIAIAGALGYFALPVSPLPQVDFPTISVQGQLPGASPDVVATSLTAPLERHLGQIADVSEMTSMSNVGQTRVILQFGLDRNIDGAAEDVQAAINAARVDLPSNLLTSPTYRKVNPADAPILILTLTSKTLTRGQMYDSASNILQQRLSQLSGVGQVIIGGAAQPAVRVELDPLQLSRYAVGIEDIRSALGNTNANAPKGDIEVGAHRWQIYTNDQANAAADYRDLVIANRNGDSLRLKDVADVQDSVQDLRNIGLANGEGAVLVIIFRQPGANIITTVDAVRNAVPQLKAAMPADIDIGFASDRSTTIRASLADTQRTLLIAAALVIVVVYLFLRSGRAALVPAVTVPVSIIGAFGAMYLIGFSLDNLSLMALTIATGFVVDDAIVVLENISRHMEEGMPRREATLRGAREIGFTVLSISISLIAVFIPILLMGGIIGRLFREFAMTLSIAILVSMAIALTTTPMMCALFLRVPRAREGKRRRSWLDRVQDGYARSLALALDYRFVVALGLIGVVALNVAAIYAIPKSFFPEQDTGRITGSMVADQSVSFQLMSVKLADMMKIVQQDPAVQDVVAFSGQGSGGAGGQTNTANVFISLKPLAERDRMDAVMGRLRRALNRVVGARLYLQPVQDIRIGGRQANAEYQYSLLGDNTQEVYEWAPKMLAALEKDKTFTDLSSDQQQSGLETQVTFDRDTAARLGLTMYQLDNTLYDAFGQRSVSTIYSAINQYHVVMEVAPPFWQRPQSLTQIFVSSSGAPASGSESTALGPVSAGPVTQIATPSAASVKAVSPSLSSAAASAANTSFAAINNAVSLATSAASATSASTTAASAAAAVATASQASLAATGTSASSSASSVSTSAESLSPLSATAKFSAGVTPLSVNHQSEFVATTLSFNLAPGKSLSDATAAIERTAREIGLPASVSGHFAGTALVYQQSLANEGYLVLAAIFAVYIVLGILYESFIHPITILSTLPSAGVGAVLTLMAFGIPMTIIALIGVILLIGIVKKNAIMMIDVALAAERERDLSSREAIFEAALLRFRPIMMTTCAAILGALPLCFSFGEGGELREPLGVAIVGGLLVSQALTLYTTPVVYLYLDRFAKPRRRRAAPGRPVPAA